jgi:hypothetical protein
LLKQLTRSDNLKKCLFCGKELIKKHYESARDFERRLYCDKECFNNHRLQKRKEKFVGKKFGKLKVFDIVFLDNECFVDVVCDCGNKKRYKYSGFKVSKPTHCGCNHGCKTHGMSNAPLYKSWSAMKRRCNSPDELHKKYYKDKGITYCEEWESFENFMDWALKNGYVENYTIERIDNSKGYFPENCKWIPAKDQNKNKTNKSHLIIGGVDKSYTEWANEYGLRENTIRMRIKYGWSGKDLLKPTKKKG